MAALRIEPSDDTPLIILNREEERFEISGKSMPENVIDFYHPVLDWMKTYSSAPLEKTIFDIKLIYFNTASSKLLLDLLMILEGIREQGNDVLVRWYSMTYDEDMQEAGQEYAEMVDLEFEYLTYDK
jgi:hypothetical protein